MILIAASIYLIVTFLLTFIGIEKQNEGIKIFIISLLLTPLAGLFYITTKKRNYKKVGYYYCHSCDYIFPVKMRHCPMCEEKGEKVKLRRYISPYKLSDKIVIADFA